MKRFNIFSVAILAAGLFTSAFVQGQSCDTLRNFNFADGPGGYNISGGGSGIIGGHADMEDGTDTYQVTAWAEPYNVSTSTQVRAVRLAPWKVEDNSGSGKITINVYTDDGGLPGTVMGSESVDLAGIIVGQFNLFEFTTPVTVNGNFHVGYELEYVTPADSFGIYLTPTGAASYTTYLFSGPGALNNTWQDVGTDFSANIALLMEVLTSNGTAPTADYQVTNAAACVGGSFGVNAGVSSGTIDTYNWSLSDNPWSQDYVEFDGTAIDVISPTVATGSQQALWLIVYGACTYDLVGYLVDVYSEVTATVTHVNASCGASDGEINITAAVGGDGTYNYSIDGGVTTQSTGLFSNLPAGTYDVEVSTDGDGCAYTETVTVVDTPGETITVGAGASICEGVSASLTASGNGTIEWFEGATSIGTGATMSVSPTATTTYDVVLTDANGCTDTDQITVTVTPLADASFAYSSNTICLGGTNETPTVTTAGGTFSASGTGLVISATNGEIDVSA